MLKLIFSCTGRSNHLDGSAGAPSQIELLALRCFQEIEEMEIEPDPPAPADYRDNAFTDGAQI